MVATADDADGVTVTLQVAGNQFGEGGVVFDQEDVGHGVFQKMLGRQSGLIRSHIEMRSPVGASLLAKAIELSQ
ncbi:hypothetical protein BR1R3_23020 [Pseudomonas atacamensis]|nr:hypothetical protein BR1R3_23020 [Pseudomonas atacamensis]